MHIHLALCLTEGVRKFVYTKILTRSMYNLS